MLDQCLVNAWSMLGRRLVCAEVCPDSCFISGPEALVHTQTAPKRPTFALRVWPVVTAWLGFVMVGARPSTAQIMHEIHGFSMETLARATEFDLCKQLDQVF